MILPPDLAAARRAARARRTPQLALTHTDVPKLLEETRRTLFPAIRQVPEAWFVEHGPLACVHISDHKAVIFIHALLNHHKTPACVFRLIAVHELLHLVIAPRVVDGILKQHPPEFFREEASLFSERDEAWTWIYNYFYAALRIDRKAERILVKRNWPSVWRRLNRPGEDWMPVRLRRPVVDFM